MIDYCSTDNLAIVCLDTAPERVIDIQRDGVSLPLHMDASAFCPSCRGAFTVRSVYRYGTAGA